MRSRSPLLLASYGGFAVFGAFWGTWGAAIPRIREEAGIDDAALGAALLFVGAGALPAMPAAGRALDRWGLWLTGPLLLALGLAGVVIPLIAAGGLPALCLGLAVVGATSGAADVALNSVAGRAEQTAGCPVITPSHATFSVVVVLSTLITGALGAVGASLHVSFGAVVVAAAVACVAIVRGFGAGGRRAADGGSPAHVPEPGAATSLSVLGGIGLLGALAFAGENAHQSWSAVFLEDELSAPPGLSALAPAVFAGVVAMTRFSVARLRPEHARTLLLTGAVGATTGTALLAGAPTLPLALAALALSAAGTAVIFPTLLGLVSRAVPERQRARATSMVTVVAYTGFLAGPAYVGLLADSTGLRGAMIAVAALTAVLAALTPLVLHRSRRGSGEQRV